MIYQLGAATEAIQHGCVGSTLIFMIISVDKHADTHKLLIDHGSQVLRMPRRLHRSRASNTAVGALSKGKFQQFLGVSIHLLRQETTGSPRRAPGAGAGRQNPV